MYLKRLEILGFKTFAERTELHFAPGVTAVIGPNGSGKSNIADAILWVLGENNVRSLRGTTAQDVIFAGNERRRPLSMAEVALTIDNSARILPLDFSEVTVTRRIFRNGESECFINKVACRLKDVYELFLDTGVGRDAYSMVNQGEIDSILSVRAEDRRAIFEEAAGIKKYRHRKKEAERKLEATHQNLIRLNDILAEIDGQLGPLARQASAARRYADVTGRLGAIETAWYGARLCRLAQECESLGQLAAQLGEERKRIEAEAEVSRAEEARAHEATAELERCVEGLRAGEAATLEQLAALSAGRARAEERVAHLRRRLEAARREVAALEERRTRRAAEAEAAEGRARETAERLRHCQEQLQRARLLSQQRQQERDRARQALASARQRSVERMRQQAERENRLSAARQRAASLAETASRLANERGEAEATLIEARRAREGAGAGLEAARHRLGEVEPEQARLAAEKRSVEEARGAMARESEGLRREMAARAGRRQALADLAERGEGAASGARALLAAAKSGALPGPWQLLAEALRVPPGLERAVEAALGPYADALVAGSDAAAVAALAWLKGKGETAILFAPVEQGHDPGRGSLAALIGADGPEATAVIRALLGDVALCETLPAPACSPATGGDATAASAPRLWVTRTGEWRSANGGWCGGAEAKERLLAAAQARRREIERLDVELLEMQERLRERDAARAQADAAAAACRDEAERIGDEVARLRAEIAAARRESERLSADAARAEQRLARIDADLDRAQRDCAAAVAQQQSCEQSLNSSRDDSAPGEDEVEAAAAAANRAEQAWQAAEGAVADLRVQAAAGEREGQAAASDAARLASAVRQMEREGAALAAERESLQRELASGEDRESGDTTVAAELDAGLARIRAQLEQAAPEKAVRARRLADAGTAVREQAARLQELVQRSHRAEIELAAVTGERARLEDLWRSSLLASADDEESEPDLEALLASWDPQQAEEALARVPDPEAEIQRLRRQVRAMGAINPNAIEEYERQSERSKFLTAQKQDLETAREQILGAIEEIDVASKEIFQKAFIEIGAAFDEMFRRLFGGGSTELRLTDPNDVLETGIEVMVQPPGKRRQNLLLLSGGERALTAAAMLLALLKIRPSPFCVLDEVDAPLDEANVGRFGGVLREFSRATQFIMVTHNRGSMEAADTLYGVTMQEKGVSKVLSCTLDDELARDAAAPAPRERAASRA